MCISKSRINVTLAPSKQAPRTLCHWCIYELSWVFKRLASFHISEKEYSTDENIGNSFYKLRLKSYVQKYRSIAQYWKPRVLMIPTLSSVSSAPSHRSFVNIEFWRYLWYLGLFSVFWFKVRSPICGILVLVRVPYCAVQWKALSISHWTGPVTNNSLLLFFSLLG